MSGSRYWSEGVMLSFSSPNHRKTTYMRSAWDRDHLPLNLATVVRVHRKGFCCSPDAFGPEKAARCSNMIENTNERTAMLESSVMPHYLTTPGRPTLGAFGTSSWVAWNSSS